MNEYNFKKPNKSNLPEEWNIKRVKDLFEIETGTTPSTKREEYWKDGNINWITPTDLSRLNVNKSINSSERKITKKALEILLLLFLI